MHGYLLFLMFLTSCLSSNSLKQQIERAQKKEFALKQKVEQLKITAAKKEVKKISEEIKTLEQTLPPHLQQALATEREKLALIIQETPEVEKEAQAVLDQILTLITSLSNNELEVF